MKLSNIVNRESIKKGLCNTGELLKKGFVIVIPVVATALINSSAEELVDKIRYSGKVSYGDTVKAILDSNMFSSAKNEAVSMLKTDGDSDYYRAVIQVIKSTMFTDSKLKMIHQLSRKDQDLS